MRWICICNLYGVKKTEHPVEKSDEATVENITKDGDLLLSLNPS